MFTCKGLSPHVLMADGKRRSRWKMGYRREDMAIQIQIVLSEATSANRDRYRTE